jgi:hypothetical protein
MNSKIGFHEKNFSNENKMKERNVCSNKNDSLFTQDLCIVILYLACLLFLSKKSTFLLRFFSISLFLSDTFFDCIWITMRRKFTELLRPNILSLFALYNFEISIVFSKTSQSREIERKFGNYEVQVDLVIRGRHILLFWTSNTEFADKKTHYDLKFGILYQYFNCDLANLQIKKPRITRSTVLNIY